MGKNIKGYKYPDFNDKITVTLIGEREIFTGYWEKSEKNILNLIKNQIKSNFGNKKISLMDLGCGDGRLLTEFEKYCEHIVALEPDKTRFDRAKERVEQLGLEDKITLINGFLRNVSTNIKPDAILCSHVLQHVPTNEVSVILNGCYNLLNPHGLFIINTTHSRQERDFYVKSYFENDSIIEEKINAKEFNELIVNDRSILPIHFFSIKNFSRKIMETGFEIIDWRIFHVLNRRLSYLKEEVDDYVNNRQELKKKVGRDLLIIARK
ncbi:MAG: methyltransferase domain-containing protein [Patescibacteria group bacterium]|nr:class I SAM-dependent methyltransferase [Patescibacteria group bacterium]